MKENKLARYNQCLAYKDWTLKDQKNVIWLDKTSVTQGGQRGRLCVWRIEEEAYYNHCIYHQWKHFKEFIFQGCFSYNLKGPYYIREEEILVEKKVVKEQIDKVNVELEAQYKLKQELSTQIRRIKIT